MGVVQVHGCVSFTRLTMVLILWIQIFPRGMSYTLHYEIRKRRLEFFSYRTTDTAVVIVLPSTKP